MLDAIAYAVDAWLLTASGIDASQSTVEAVWAIIIVYTYLSRRVVTTT